MLILTLAVVSQCQWRCAARYFPEEEDLLFFLFFFAVVLASLTLEHVDVH